MNLARRLSLAVGIIFPFLLSGFDNCDRGLLGFIRSQNAYMTIHTGGASFDFNNVAIIDLYIVFGLSSLLVGFFLFTRRPNQLSSNKGLNAVLATFGLRTKHTKIAALFLTLFIEFLIFIFTWGIEFSRCFQF